MTEKQFYIKCDDFNAWMVWEKGKDVIVFDLHKSTAQLVCDKLNELSEENDVLKQQLKTKYIVNKQYEELQRLKQENEQLKLSFTEFAKMIEFDMDNGIEVYPKRLLEYIINISKEYGK